MNLKEACEIFDVLPTALENARLYVVCNGGAFAQQSLDQFKGIVKQKYKRLAIQLHPDSGGSTDDFQKLNEAHGIIANATVSDVISLLRDAEVRYTPGDEKCKTCTKWNPVTSICMTVSCSGFNPTQNYSMSSRV